MLDHTTQCTQGVWLSVNPPQGTPMPVTAHVPAHLGQLLFRGKA